MFKPSSSLQLLFHTFGLGCVSSAIFLQALVFWDISQTGFFKATEQNQFILSIEIFLTIFAFIYFIYMYQRFVRSVQ
jgi:hypothetical protein